MPEQKVFDYEHMAIRGEEMPDGLPSYDQTMFLNLRSLYDQYRKGLISREIAKKEKNKLIKAWEYDKFLYELGMQWSERYKRMETLSAEYSKNPSIEVADKIMKVIYF